LFSPYCSSLSISDVDLTGNSGGDEGGAAFFQQVDGTF